MIDSKENCIEWITGEDRVTLTLSQRKYITSIKKLEKKYPNEVEIVSENKDGSICVHLPLSYISVRHPKVLSEETKEKAKTRMLNARNLRKTN